MSYPTPAPRTHDPDCERASQPGCVCPCLSLMHQCDVLDAMLEPRGAAADAERELNKMFGSAFTDFSDPTPAQTVRRGNWQHWATSPASAQENTQREQRIVDVALRDVLAHAHQVQRFGDGWLSLGDDLRARGSWWTIAGAIEKSMSAAATASDHRTRGYFWSTMLAAASAAARLDNPPMPTQIAAAVTSPPRRVAGAVDPLPGIPMFGRILYPRQGIPNTIAEVTVPAAVKIAADQIAAALSVTPLPPEQARLVLQIVGITICPDLWRHPAAVKFLLIPAIRTLRIRWKASFSLDNNPAGATIENLIRTELGDKWATWRGRGGSW